MQKFLLLLPLLILASPAQAVRLVVQDPCAAAPWLDVEASASVGDSVGLATIATLDREAVPYVGNDHGINSIRDTVTGDRALEILSDREMRAYGWCFRINGREPNEFAHQVMIESEDDVVYWVFGFAHYLDGRWISNCTPTHTLRPAHVCGQVRH